MSIAPHCGALFLLFCILVLLLLYIYVIIYSNKEILNTKDWKMKTIEEMINYLFSHPFWDGEKDINKLLSNYTEEQIKSAFECVYYTEHPEEQGVA